MKDRIRKIRKELGFNQTDFGAKLGVKPNTVSGWEHGLVPDERSIKAICREFGINYAWLVHGLGEEHIDSDYLNYDEIFDELNITEPDEKQMLMQYLQLPHETRRKIVEVSKCLIQNHKNDQDEKTGST